MDIIYPERGICVKKDKNIMVCVTQQKTCERLIKKGKELRDKIGGELHVVHVAREDENFLGNSKQADAIEYLYGISKLVGADMTVLRSNDVCGAITKFAEEYEVGHIILGEPPKGYEEDSVVDSLRKNMEDVNFYLVS